MTAIWAYTKNVPGKTCDDARLLGGGTILYPDGNDAGQAGWDIGLMFNSLGDLAEKLRLLKFDKDKDKGVKISRLAINVHGSPGRLDVDSVRTEAGSYDFERLWKRRSSEILSINRMLGFGAVVLIMGCSAARGKEGTALLTQLSSEVFINHKVVGFTTVGTTIKQYRKGESCSEPGMRDTNYENPSVNMPSMQAQREKVALTFPWASETSPHAKIAWNGKIIHGAEPQVPETDYNPDVYLPGTWSVESGPWKGYFLFSKLFSKQGASVSWGVRDVSWLDENSSFRHPGQWWTVAGGVHWQFETSPNKTWNVILPLKSLVLGKTTIRGTSDASFIMVKQS